MQLSKWMTWALMAATGAAGAENAPEVFAPGVISSAAHDSAPAFSGDGREVYFGRSSATVSFILASRRKGELWSAPAIAAFSGVWNDMEPALSPDGSYLVFVSNRPATAGGEPLDGTINGKLQPRRGANLWRVARSAKGWDTPERLPDVVNSSVSTYAPSIAANGDLYFMRPDGPENRFRLFVATMRAGAYLPPTPLPFSTGVTTDVDPAVLPDGSALVFGSSRQRNKDIDLFIVFRRGNDWGQPVYLGDTINSPTSDAEPRWGPDRRTLYFSSERLAPVPTPIPPGSAVRALDDLARWNNGLYNIWKVDLADTLKAMANP
jgi:Tol biopolymer transport system component